MSVQVSHTRTRKCIHTHTHTHHTHIHTRIHSLLCKHIDGVIHMFSMQIKQDCPDAAFEMLNQTEKLKTIIKIKNLFVLES